jgi:hypothetical protein
MAVRECRTETVMNSDERMALVRMMPCVACTISGTKQPNKTEAHHCNFDGKAGQKRRGDWFTIPLCRWHHQAIPPDGMSAMQAAMIYGPSLAKSSKRFRETFGEDDVLLARVNELIEQQQRVA